MNKKRSYIILGVIIVICALLYMNSSEKSVVSYGKDTQIVRVGVAAALTGYAAEWGEGELSATKMIIDEFNKKSKKSQIELIVEDTKADGLGTTNAIKKLIEVDKVEAIIGPTWGDSFQGGFPISTLAKVWTITPSSALETIGEKKKEYPYLLSLWWPQKDEIQAMQDFVLKQGYKNLAVVNDKDAYNVSMGADFVVEAKKRGISIVAHESVPVSTTDFRTTILKLKNTRPDAVFVLMQDTSQLGPFTKQLRELGLKSKTGGDVRVLSTTSTENQGNLSTFPGLFEGIYYTFPSISEDNLYKKYLDQHNKNTNGKPTGPSFVNALNAARALVVAVENRDNSGGEGFLQVDKVKAPGVGIEEIEFNSNGQIVKSNFLIKTIENNIFKIVN